MANLPFRDINVHASTNHYAFTSPSSPNKPTLVIERPSGDIRLNDGSLLGSKRVSSIAGILGVIKLKLDKYVITITKAQPVGRLRGHMVYKVVATEFMPLRERRLHDPDEDTYLAYLKALLNTGPMYFSYSIDITSSFQRQSESDLNLPLWQRADERFFWNRFVQTDLIDFRTGAFSGAGIRLGAQPGIDPYILPVMFGMMRIVTTSIKGTPFTFALITRRSRHRGGTRYFSRGIDDQGHVSNFNETEQVVILNDPIGGPAGFAGGQGMQNGRIGSTAGQELQVFSYLQTRGSVPVYWAEVNNLQYTPKLQVRGVESAVDAARKHFNEQIRIYGENYLVNLVNQRGREERVKKAYEQVVRVLVSTPSEAAEADQRSAEKDHTIDPLSTNRQMDRLHYIYFDFHNETKGLKWHRAQLLLDQLRDGLTRGGYFRGVELPGDSTDSALEARLKQGAVVRTNCMDCLDRTNVVQSMLGRWALTQQLRDARILDPSESCDDDRTFEDLYRNIWADNADVVSNSYSGTGALKTDFTRTGNRTRRGMAQDFSNSVTRYVRNNFTDGPRQDGFDLFLGAYLPSNSGAGSALLFTDRRPIILQGIPYVLAASGLMIFLWLLTRPTPGSRLWPMRLFMVVWFFVGLWCLNFIYKHGMLYVNWPKLNTPVAAQEGVQEALNHAYKDPVIGPLLAKSSGTRARNISLNRIGVMEEGKKRIE
ncbi:MAG: hypothetical protein Q9227_000700 [Pyrenula ochraceoflavens]